MSLVGNIASFTPEQIQTAFTDALDPLVTSTGQPFSIAGIDFSAAADVVNQGLQVAVGSSIGLG